MIPESQLQAHKEVVFLTEVMRHLCPPARIHERREMAKAIILGHAQDLFMVFTKIVKRETDPC